MNKDSNACPSTAVYAITIRKKLMRKIMMGEVTLQSLITCPYCGHQKQEEMPTDACQFFYACEGCGEVIKPQAGDCCVFCSYGTVPCPPVQQGDGTPC